MLPIFHSTSFTMRNDRPDRISVWKWTLLASLVAHLLVVALVLPESLVTPLKGEREITVQLLQLPAPPAKPKTEPAPPANESKPEKPQEASAAIRPPTSNDGTQQGNSPAMKPVFLFGDKDRSARKSADGTSARSGSASPAARPDPVKQSLPQTLAVKTAGATDAIPQATPTRTPTPADGAEAQPGPKLPKAETLPSDNATVDMMAMTAMRYVPRDERAGKLCLTELREQLLHASPAYSPDLLPLERITEGTLIEVPKTAFRSNQQWYDLSYRCEVDTLATKVVTFTFQVGEPVPRDEWTSRGFPSQ